MGLQTPIPARTSRRREGERGRIIPGYGGRVQSTQEPNTHNIQRSGSKKTGNLTRSPHGSYKTGIAIMSRPRGHKGRPNRGALPQLQWPKLTRLPLCRSGDRTDAAPIDWRSHQTPKRTQGRGLHASVHHIDTTGNWISIHPHSDRRLAHRLCGVRGTRPGVVRIHSHQRLPMTNCRRSLGRVASAGRA